MPSPEAKSLLFCMREPGYAFLKSCRLSRFGKRNAFGDLMVQLHGSAEMTKMLEAKSAGFFSFFAIFSLGSSARCSPLLGRSVSGFSRRQAVVED